MDPEEDRLILVGRVAGAFGVRGELRITSYTSDPMSLVSYRELRREDGRPALTLQSGRAAKGGIIARAKEVATPEQANALRGLRLHVPRSVLPATEEDEFYLTDLIGLQARTPEGEALGRIRAVPNFGAGDMLEIEPEGGGRSWYLPFTRDCAPEVRIAEGYVTAVKPVETE